MPLDIVVAWALQGKLHEAVESLLNLEKMSRLAEDGAATKACCTAVLDVIYQVSGFTVYIVGWLLHAVCEGLRKIA